MSIFALFAPPNIIDEQLLKLFSADTVNFVVWPFIQIGAVVTMIAVWALYASYLERKISAFMQARLGPMRVGKWGLLQPIADAVKLLTKEDLMPERADPYIFRFAPYIAVAATFLTFSVVPFAPNWGVITDVNIGLLLVLAVSSVGVLARVATHVFLRGWYFPGVLRLAGGYNNLYVFLSLSVFVVKCAVLLYLYLWFRWTFPRYRYDQLMDLGWKWLIPASLLNIVWTALTIFVVQALDGWNNIQTIKTAGGLPDLSRGVSLTRTGNAVAVAFGWAGLIVAAVFLALL